MNLVEALKKFNRKERYWLIKNAIGDNISKSEKEPKFELNLGCNFINTLNKKLDIFIPADAWWAMDYHIDWLIGASFLCQAGTDLCINQVNKNDEHIVKGNQQDIDFVIAYDKKIIFIEAKCDTPWYNEQLNSKIDRLEKCFKKFKYIENNIEVFFVLMSVHLPSPKTMHRTGSKNNKNWDDFPCWMKDNNQNIYWISMNVDQKFYKVTRCSDKEGTVNKSGEYWKII